MKFSETAEKERCEHEWAICVDCKKSFRTDEFYRKGKAKGFEAGKEWAFKKVDKCSATSHYKEGFEAGQNSYWEEKKVKLCVHQPKCSGLVECLGKEYERGQKAKDIHNAVENENKGAESLQNGQRRAPRFTQEDLDEACADERRKCEERRKRLLESLIPFEKGLTAIDVEAQTRTKTLDEVFGTEGIWRIRREVIYTLNDKLCTCPPTREEDFHVEGCEFRKLLEDFDRCMNDIKEKFSSLRGDRE